MRRGRSIAQISVQARLLPVRHDISHAGNPVTLGGAEHQLPLAVGPISVTVSPGGQTVTLADDELHRIRLRATVSSPRSGHALHGQLCACFPWGDAVQVEVSAAITSFQSVNPSYVNIAEPT